jgi:hypothetical protein
MSKAKKLRAKRRSETARQLGEEFIKKRREKDLLSDT